MSRIYKDCPYCFSEITKKPILQKLQDRYSILCPFCYAHRSEWVSTTVEAIESWNKYIREDNPQIFYIKLPLAYIEKIRKSEQLISVA